MKLYAIGHSNHIFGPPIHGADIEFEEAPLPLPANVVISIANGGMYSWNWTRMQARG